MRRKGRRPTPAKLVEGRSSGNKQTTKIFINPEEIDPVWLDRFLGKIFFWSFAGLRKLGPSDHTTKMRVSTHNFIPRHKIFPLVEGAFPEGCEVKLVRGYQFTHSFDIKLSRPMRVDSIIWRITKSLEGVLR